MRYPPGHKEKTRLQIIKAAARVFSQNGYHGSGIDGIMAEAGLTSGGFYSHFKSKDDLLISMIQSWPQIIREIMPEDVQGKEGPQFVMAMCGWYLSPGHRDGTEFCCPISCILSEIGLLSEKVQEAFAEVECRNQVMDFIAQSLTNHPEQERSLIAEKIKMICLGAITTARAMGDTQESSEYLERAKLFIFDLFFSDQERS